MVVKRRKTPARRTRGGLTFVKGRLLPARDDGTSSETTRRRTWKSTGKP
jgi:hypothetical protein